MEDMSLCLFFIYVQKTLIWPHAGTIKMHRIITHTSAYKTSNKAAQETKTFQQLLKHQLMLAMVTSFISFDKADILADNGSDTILTVTEQH